MANALDHVFIPARFWLAAAILLAAALASLLAGYPVRRLLCRWQVIDEPNARSSHTLPTVRGGGLGIMAVILTGGTLLLLHAPAWPLAAIISAAALLAGVSLADDRRPLSWRVRILVQIFCAAAVVAVLWSAWLPDSRLSALTGMACMVFVVVGYANAFNFMDGINGLAAGQALLSSLGAVVIALLAGIPASHPGILLLSIISGAAGGFLPHNFPQARMFMGDVGSVPLGFLSITVSLWLARDGGLWLGIPLALLHANFVLDTGITLVRRMCLGEVLHQAHREHFYQRLIKAGYSHTLVTTAEGLLEVITGLIAAMIVLFAAAYVIFQREEVRA